MGSRQGNKPKGEVTWFSGIVDQGAVSKRKREREEAGRWDAMQGAKTRKYLPDRESTGFCRASFQPSPRQPTQPDCLAKRRGKLPSATPSTVPHRNGERERDEDQRAVKVDRDRDRDR